MPTSTAVVFLRRLCLLLWLCLLVLVSATPASAAAATCDRYAGPFGSDYSSGSLTQPYHSVQKLANVLTAGQTGCLLNGTYSEELDGQYVVQFRHGGAPGAPITLRSAPGQRAALRGIVYLPEGADYVTISDLDIDGRRLTPDKAVGIQMNARSTILERNDITNHGQAICASLGFQGWGRAVGSIVRQNTFHDCGGTTNQLEHSLYVDYAVDVLITDNLFLRSGTYALHLYPDATSVTVSHNVMVGNGGGVIFAGEGDSASSRDTVTQNVIVGSYRRPGIHSWWGGAVGSGNLAKSNCLSNSTTNVDVSGGGFTSSNNVIAPPGFRDAADGDYRLASSSPCLALVGYDTAAKLRGDPIPPQATPGPTPPPTGTPPPPSATPGPIGAPDPTPPPQADNSAPELDPDVKPVEAARLAIDDGAFSASGGTSCRPRDGARCPSAKR